MPLSSDQTDTATYLQPTGVVPGDTYHQVASCNRNSDTLGLHSHFTQNPSWVIKFEKKYKEKEKEKKEEVLVISFISMNIQLKSIAWSHIYTILLQPWCFLCLNYHTSKTFFLFLAFTTSQSLNPIPPPDTALAPYTAVYADRKR